MASEAPTQLGELDGAFNGLRDFLVAEYPDVGFLLVAVTPVEDNRQSLVLRTNGNEVAPLLLLMSRALEAIAQTAAKPIIIDPNAPDGG